MRTTLYYNILRDVSGLSHYLPDALKPPKKATHTVVSSITCSSTIQRSLASLINLSTAYLGSVVCSAISITSWSVMNSHKPSDARTKIRSSRPSGLNSYSTNSGSEDTPAECATASPRERLMASPGTSICPSHTRGGPSTPSSYSTANTRPPFSSMRAFSAGRSGLWSCEMAMPVIPPAALRYPIVLRESPMLPVVMVFPRITAHVKVVPEKSVSMEGSLSISLSTLATTSPMAVLMSSAKERCLNK
mmetsp:Transcript_11318/g.18431  ORF Transcript_11318/g.18431 Transcript_11318/m.18431 type:complete len:247 (-) Transcript_11318:398-1138(-)